MSENYSLRANYNYTFSSRAESVREQPMTKKKLGLLKNQAVKMLAKWMIFFAIASYLIYQLSKTGWSEIYAALPTSPLFYSLSIGFVLAPVVAEVLSFQVITGKKTSTLRKVFLRKHIFNKAVMNFSGDAYFIQKISTHDNLGLRRAAIILKDMTLLRAFVANSWIVGLVIAAVIFGKLDVLKNIVAVSPALALIVGIFSLSVVGGAIVLFRKLTKLELSVAMKVASIYFARSFIIGGILISQWSFAIPGAEFADWFIFLLVFYLAKKSPIGGELLFASIIVTLPGLAGDTAAVAAMLIAIAAVTQLLYFIGFLATLETKGLRRFMRKKPRHNLPRVVMAN